MGTDILKIGSRGSRLALWQANWVKNALLAGHPDLVIEIIIIKTRGDKILDVPLAKVGGKGLFVKEIENALADSEIDLAVHSMKDMPAKIPEGLCIGAVPKREKALDVLISRKKVLFKDLPKGACIGTSSLRRSSQLLYLRPDIKIKPLRGNLDTRLKKLDSEKMDAIILAAAGVKRLGMEKKITEYLDQKIMLPAVGQGALCIETRLDDPFTAPLIASLDHAPTHTVVIAERTFLNHLEGGCQIPIAAHGIFSGNDQIELKGLVAEINGAVILKETVRGPAGQPEILGHQLAELLLQKGAGQILAKL